MLKRLWFVLSGIWALCNIIPDADGLDAKVLEIALAPFALGWFIAVAARFVVTGSVTRRRSVPYRHP